jgi:cold shock CspA family protein
MTNPMTHSDDKKLHGHVKRFFEERGYGFISRADGFEDVFLHISRCPESKAPKHGAPVTFQIEDSERGPQRWR